MKWRLVILLTACSCLTVAGCTTEYNLATQRQESLLYGTEKEVKIGEAVSRQIEEEYKVIHDLDVNERLEHILDRLVAVGDRRELVYFIRALDDDLVNAVSLPGGYIYVFKGLLDKVKSDDQLAGVIAHELGHITARHGIKRLQSSYGALLVQILAATQTNANVAGGVQLALASLFMEYSQADEYEADRLSVKYLKKAGYNTQGIVDVLDVLKKEQEKADPRPFSYWRTHPHISKRMAVVNQEITGKLEFRDYLNLIENE